MEKDVVRLKQTISTIKQRGKHPLAVRNTQHLYYSLKTLLKLVLFVKEMNIEHAKQSLLQTFIDLFAKVQICKVICLQLNFRLSCQ